MSRRDPFLDLLRGFCLAVVVLMHLGFTVVQWRADGPHTSSPLEFTPGLWIVTWVFQIMPLFFYIGGHAHLRAREAYDGTLARFVAARLRRLLVPALALTGVWTVIGLGLSFAYDLDVIERTLRLILSPLWFIAVYALLVTLLPLTLRLRERFGLRALAGWTAVVIAVDVARLAYGVPYVEWVNLVAVWALAHQAGHEYERLRALPARAAIACTGTGLAALTALVVAFDYPGAMVGVPGTRFSNMSPPTVAVAALLAVQIGLVALIRRPVAVRLDRPGGRRLVAFLNRHGLPVFLLHTTGGALFAYGLWRSTGTALTAESSDAGWWAGRPVMLAGSLACTALLVAAFTRRRRAAPELSSPDRSPRSPSAAHRS